MGSFFYGRRRKLGCITLVAALALTVVWGRSLMVVDIIVWHGGTFEFTLVSGGGDFLVARGDQFMVQQVVTRDGIEITLISGIRSISFSSLIDRYQSNATKVRIRRSLSDDFDSGAISYWAIITPLTVVSAYLILVRSKQRRLAAESQSHA